MTAMAENRKVFTAYVEWDPDTNLYVGTVPGIPGAHSQGVTLDELQANLKEVLGICVDQNRSKEPPAVRLATTA